MVGFAVVSVRVTDLAADDETTPKRLTPAMSTAVAVRAIRDGPLRYDM
jgi:hypothetical protein